MKLFIKNMVCNRCISAVRARLEENGLHITGIELGEVELQEKELSAGQMEQTGMALVAAGFELIDDRRGRTIEKIKNTIVDLIHYTDEQPREKHSVIIAASLNYDYTYLSKLFSEVEGITIEQYIIQQKIEKIKEYLVYDELSLTQIADSMGYSSVAHLSAQFKKITGLPPTHFKNIGTNQRKALDKINTK